jgi:DNA topoisomerase-3
MQEKDPVACTKADKKEKKTKAPPRFTEGTLVKAMETVHKFVEDNDLRKLLKEEDGIGTPATRATIISELKRRGFLEARKKAVVSTVLGRSLVDALPEEVRSPVLTALYEREFKAIQAGESTVEAFLAKQSEFVRQQVETANSRATEVAGAPMGDGPECPSCGKGRLRRVEGSKGAFWSCSRWRAEPPCKATWEDRDGKPQTAAPEGAVSCPVCKQGYLRRIKWKDGHFWGCTRFREGCKGSAEDVEGRPEFGAPRGKGAVPAERPGGTAAPLPQARRAPIAAPAWGDRDKTESVKPVTAPPPAEEGFLPGLF